MCMCVKTRSCRQIRYIPESSMYLPFIESRFTDLIYQNAIGVLGIYFQRRKVCSV